MRFEEADRITHPASVVLETMIERMEAIVPFLPAVEAITTREREDRDDGTHRIVRHWQGTPDSAPPAVRPFLTRETLGWIDTAVWTPSAWSVAWSHSATASTANLYDCSGINYFEPDPADPEGATRVRITGDLVVYPERLPGVPGFLAKRIAPQVERFVVNMITPNLKDLARGLQGFLDQEG